MSSPPAGGSRGRQRHGDQDQAAVQLVAVDETVVVDEEPVGEGQLDVVPTLGQLEREADGDATEHGLAPAHEEGVGAEVAAVLGHRVGEVVEGGRRDGGVRGRRRVLPPVEQRAHDADGCHRDHRHARDGERAPAGGRRRRSPTRCASTAAKPSTSTIMNPSGKAQW